MRQSECRRALCVAHFSAPQTHTRAVGVRPDSGTAFPLTAHPSAAFPLTGCCRGPSGLWHRMQHAASLAAPATDLPQAPQEARRRHRRSGRGAALTAFYVPLTTLYVPLTALYVPLIASIARLTASSVPRRVGSQRLWPQCSEQDRFGFRRWAVCSFVCLFVCSFVRLFVCLSGVFSFVCLFASLRCAEGKGA